ncbi:MAG: hypothetical protein ICV69_12250 [Thermoleophilaceae bacterium]|nr:hypothetical protein [Thermoleophilaceae bacterium]
MEPALRDPAGRVIAASPPRRKPGTVERWKFVLARAGPCAAALAAMCRDTYSISATRDALGVWRILQLRDAGTPQCIAYAGTRPRAR